MDEQDKREGLGQQRDDDRRRQADQQNRQGQPRRHDGDDLQRATPNPLDTGLEGGVDTGAIEPGKT